MRKMPEKQPRVPDKEHADTLKSGQNVATADSGQERHTQVSDSTEEPNLPEDTSARLTVSELLSDSTEEPNLREDRSVRLTVSELRIRDNTLITTSELLEDIPEVFNASNRPLFDAPAKSLYDLRVIRELVAGPGQPRKVSVRTIQGLTQYILSVYKKNNYSGIYVYVQEGAIRNGTSLVDEILPISIIESPVGEIGWKFFDAN